MEQVSQGEYRDRDDVDTVFSKYNREAERTYPYRVHWQKGRCYFAALSCSLIAILNGWRSISPFDVADFLASYISVSVPTNIPGCRKQADTFKIVVFILLIIFFRFSLQGTTALHFALYPRLSLAEPNSLDAANPAFGRHRLSLKHGNTWSLQSLGAILTWVRAWLI